MKILCVDDDNTFLTIYKATLGKILFPEDELELLDTGTKVENLLDKSSFDLVITDLVMPEVSGLDVLRIVKDKRPQAEVIVVTGQASIDSAVEAMRLGARDYLTKPINTSMLTEKISNIREFLLREQEAEDYRYAKEAIEESAIKTVNEMEIKLNNYIELISSIKDLLTKNDLTDDARSEILKTISETENNIL